MKKAFTLVELLISISLLASIMVASTAIFVSATKNYQISITKSDFQKEINFTIDDIAKNVKSALSVPQTYDTFTTSQETLILSLPVLDTDGSFIYTGSVNEKDYFVYYLSGSDLHLKIYGNPAGIRSSQDGTDKILLSNITQSDIFSYSPSVSDASTVTTNLTLSKIVQKTNIKVTAKRVVNLRNK